MRTRLSPKLTYANVIATIALFLALGGGAAWAASSIPRNSVGAAQIKSGAVTGEKIRNGTLLASAFKAGELPTGAQGEPGEPGEVGPQGEIGPRGETGAPGKAGPQGEAGPEGEAGERGARGERGLQGEPGEPGEAGEQGPRGQRGAEGAEGPEGERGPQGREGEAGTTEVVVRYGKFISPEKGSVTSYAACKPGETVTGGGFDFLAAPTTRTNYVIQANRPSMFETFEEEEEEEESAYPTPKNGFPATGWAVTIEATGERVSFRSYTMCATTGVAGEETGNQELHQEGQQILQLLH
jgi:Collagen triple helix repeat (20 copies)